MPSILRILSPSCLPALREASCHVVRCPVRGPHGTELVPSASRHMNVMKVDPCPVIPGDDCSPTDTLIKLSHAQILNPQLWGDKCSFKLQNVGVICYTSIDKTVSFLIFIKILFNNAYHLCLWTHHLPC